MAPRNELLFVKPSSVNLALAAVDHFYQFLELPTPKVAREDLAAQAPHALEPPEQKRFLRAVERFASARDRAIALLLFYTGLRIGPLPHEARHPPDHAQH